MQRCCDAGVLTSVLLYGPLVADHCLLSAGLQPGAKVNIRMANVFF